MDDKIWLGLSFLIVLLICGFANRRMAAARKIRLGQITEERTRLEQAIQSAEAECLAQRQAAAAAREFAECLLQSVTNPVLVSNAAGLLVSANPAAQALLGLDAARAGESITEWATRHGLRYPSGQPVPPGSVPLARTISDGQATERAEFLLTSKQATQVVEITTVPLLSAEKTRCAGTVAILNDVTDLRHSRQQESIVQAHIAALARIGGQLAAAVSAEHIIQLVIEGVPALMPPMVTDVRAAWFGLEDKRLILLGETPRRNPRRPRTQQQTQRPNWPFNAQLPLAWQLYVARQSVLSADVTDDERFDDLEARPLLSLAEVRGVRSLLAVPLVNGKHVGGHLVVTSSQPGVLGDKSLQDALASLAAMAALARINVSLAEQHRQNALEMKTLWTVSQAIAAQKHGHAAAAIFAESVRSALSADMCLLSFWEMTSSGERRIYYQEMGQEDVLLPGQTLTHSPAGCVGCDHLSQETVRGNSVMQTSIPNPAFGDCRWRAFAGLSGVHSILASPIRRGEEVIGALTVYRSGETPFSPPQIQLLETFAMLYAAAVPDVPPRNGALDVPGGH